MMNDNPYSDRRFPCGVGLRPWPQGFSLLELLVVMLIIALLGGITFGAFRAVTERNRVARAEAELGVVAQSLESYRNQYGDYPRVSLKEGDAMGEALYAALTGRRGPEGAELNPPGRTFIDTGAFTLAVETGESSGPNAFLDPWGNAYRYLYDPEIGGWEPSGFLLFSMGPDGEEVLPAANGALDTTAEANRDIILVGLK